MKSPFELSVILLAVSTVFASAAFGADIFSGTWTLNTSKTTVDNFRIPTVERIDSDDNGIKAVAVDSEGKIHVEYAVKFDDRAYPYIGMLNRTGMVDAPYTTCTAKKISEDAIEFTIMLRDMGKTRMIGRQIMSVSKDGKTRTVTLFPTDQSPGLQQQVIVWDKNP